MRYQIRFGMPASLLASWSLELSSRCLVVTTSPLEGTALWGWPLLRVATAQGRWGALLPPALAALCAWAPL